jgi:hypothetical protein
MCFIFLYNIFVGNMVVYIADVPITVAARSKTWTVFARSNAGVFGSNLTQGMDVCVYIYSVFVLSLRRADPPSEESYRLCKNDYETEEEVRAQQRAVVPLMNEWIADVEGARIARSV